MKLRYLILLPYNVFNFVIFQPLTGTHKTHKTHYSTSLRHTNTIGSGTEPCGTQLCISPVAKFVFDQSVKSFRQILTKLSSGNTQSSSEFLDENISTIKYPKLTEIFWCLIVLSLFVCFLISLFYGSSTTNKSHHLEHKNC